MTQVEERQARAQKAREVRERFREIVPDPARLDGLGVLHTYRVPHFMGRPLEIGAWAMVLVFTLFCWGVLVMVGDWNPWLSIPFAGGGGWILGRRFFRGDGRGVKLPWVRQTLRDRVNFIVSGGSIRPMRTRYEFIDGGKVVDWEDTL